MIGRLAGRVVHRGTETVMLDVGGVGYAVQVSARTLAELPPVGEAAVLWTEMVVRQDLIALIGYPTVEEVEWHRLLTGVQGVGSKAALAILGALGPEGLARAIALSDWNAVKAAQGVGPKLAQRVVNELRGKGPTLAVAPGPAGPLPAGGSTAEAVSALVNLGYGASEAQRAVAEAGRDGEEGTPALIRGALKRLAPA